MYRLLDPSTARPPTGLRNLGATCWFNALLQALLSCTSLPAVLAENAADYAQNRFVTEYMALLSADQPAPDRLYAELLRAMREAGHTFGARQECADEGLTYLLELFGEPIQRLFAIEYEVRIRCECGRVARHRDRGFRLPVFTRVDIQDDADFMRFVKHRQSQTEKFDCVCGLTTRNIARDERLVHAGEIFVVLFNQFREKKAHHFPCELTLPSRETNLVYRAVATIEHAGSHYWAVCERAGRAYVCNDSAVSEADGVGQPSANTYMVFYHMTREEPK